jgi:hypothetical protein
MLKKADNELHEHLLSVMCGMTPNETRERLKRLSEQLGVIYHFSGTCTYRFYAGVGLDDLRRVTEDDVSGAWEPGSAPLVAVGVKLKKANPGPFAGRGSIASTRPIHSHAGSGDFRLCSQQEKSTAYDRW